jgi:hypothetical protein
VITVDGKRYIDKEKVLTQVVKFWSNMYRKNEKVVQGDLAELLSKSVTTEESDQLKKELSLEEFR